MRRWAGAAVAAASLLTAAACGGQVVPLANVSVVSHGDGCTDRAGDSTGAVDLSNVVVRAQAPRNRWRVSWTLAHPPKPHADVRYELHASGTGGGKRTLVVEASGGKPIKHYVQLPHRRIDLPIEMAETTRTVQVTGSRIVGFFPGPSLNDFASGWGFYATVTVDGAIVDSCPDQRGGTPRVQRFTG